MLFFKDEVIEMLTIIRSSINNSESSKNEGRTVLNDVSPNSLEFVIDEAIIALNKGDGNMVEQYFSPHEIDILMNETLDLIRNSTLDEDKKAKYRARVMRAVNTENSYYNLLAEACAIQLLIDINKFEASKEPENYQPTYVPIKDIQEATEDRIIELSMSSMMTCDICGRKSTKYDPVEQALLFPYGADRGVIPINYCHTCYMHRSDKVKKLQTNISSEKEE